MIIKKKATCQDFCIGTKESDLQTVGCVNWPDEFPDKPEVRFAIMHTGDHICLKFFVTEQYTMARVTEDNGEVWTDSCVEFFISFDDSGYYNFEFTCIGKALLGFRKEREKYEHASKAVMDSIIRMPSLGTEPFGERSEGQSWELAVKIPARAFFKHDIRSFDGMEARANFYKCGDKLTRPHFLSWQPIDNHKPDFHLEKFFGEVKFE